MEIRFTSIHWLWALPPALVLVWALGLRLTSLSRARRLTILILRSILFALILLALAGLEVSRVGDKLAVMVIIDESDSIPPEMRQYTRAFYKKAVDEMGPNDLIGAMLFGADASIERNPAPKAKFEEFNSVPVRTQTNIADALRLGMAALPAGAKKRIVLLSDGNQTTNDAEEAARAAAANGIALDVVPLHYEFREDVILDKVVVENQVAVDEPFDVKIFVDSRRDTQAKLNVFSDGELVATQDVTLAGGRKNVFELPAQARRPGYHSYSAKIEAPDDANPQNNLAHSFTVAQGEPRVLYVEGSPAENNRLVALLRQEKIDCDLIQADQFPNDPAELQSYNSIVFSNVPASAITRGQMRLVERAVHELGMGFIMTGGENSFGAGGWQDTPVEEALPVSMDLKNKKILPQGALVVIMHTCEIPQGEYWSREIAMASLNVLSERDEFGALAYQWNKGEDWVVPLQEARDKQAMRKIIAGSPNGDMPDFNPIAKMAYQSLKESKASVKHIVIISDGDPQPPAPEVITAMRQAGITISTIVIGSHGQPLAMQTLAQQGGGQFYEVKDPQKLPQIFVKEASVIRKSLIFEKDFTPEMKTYSDVLPGFRAGEYPDLHGYVGATAKDLSTVPLIASEEDPLMAHWRYGLGKSVAFTSDVYMRWARDWYSWEKMAKFWSQVVRWSLRSQRSETLQTSTEIDNGEGRIVVDAVDKNGRFINFLDLEGGVIDPAFESQPIAFKQTGPGRYEAKFDAAKVGNYIVTTHAKGAGGFDESVSGGASLSYSPEFQTSRSNDSLMRKLAEIGKGRELDKEGIPIFDHNLPGGIQPQPVWPLLLALAVLLLPFDIFFRRVLVDWGMIREGLLVAGAFIAARLRFRRGAARAEGMESLLDAKRQALEGRAQTARPPAEARKALLEQLDKVDARDDIVSAAKAASRSAPAPAVEKAVDPKDEAEGKAGGFTNKLLEAKKRAKR